MKKLILALAASLLAAGAFAQAPQKMPEGKAAPVAAAANAASGDCEAKAVSKSGKPLAGAAKSAFVKKCMQDSANAQPQPKPEVKPEVKPAPEAKGGPTTQQNKMKECAEQGKGKKGDDYKTFMKTCLGGK